jgi:C1A family cysteine protease
MGWLPDLPDFRDCYLGHEDLTPLHKDVSNFFKKKNLVSSPLKLSSTYIIPENSFSPIEDQGPLGSCTANAAVGLIEYYQKKTTGKFIDMSRLFLYKVTRNLLGLTGDTGAYLRTTMAAMVLFGSPPEGYYPYKIQEFDNEPSAFMYSFAKEFQTMRYYRLDSPQIPANELLSRIKRFLSRQMPSMFGFTVFNSINQASSTGEIPFPCNTDNQVGGHAMVAVGYDDNKEIKNKNCGLVTKGAIRIRNSWGTSWGDNGYGWLPYDYILKELAMDWWSLMRAEWTDMDVFAE